MILIDTIPEELLEELNKLSTWFFSQDLSDIRVKPSEFDYESGTSLEYLLNAQSDERVGFPKAALGVDFNQPLGYTAEKWHSKIMSFDSAIKSYLGSKTCALRMYYPTEGYIDWHTNANAYGYNVLLTYSQTGEGEFKYQHPITKEIVVLKDKPGWSMKLGMYDLANGAPLWHCAWTKCPRLNWGYILHQTSWNLLLDEVGVSVEDMESIYGPLPTFDKDTHSFPLSDGHESIFGT